MIEAILYVEFAAGTPSTAEMLMVSLMNCKQLVYDIPGGYIVHIACNDPESLNQAINHDFAGIEGISQITTCIVKKR